MLGGPGPFPAPWNFALKLQPPAADTAGSVNLLPMNHLPPSLCPLPLTKRLRRPALRAAVLAAAWLLGGCDQLGIESATALAARKEAEGKAIGAGCRHAARSVEQCYVTNKRADKAAVFAGWKEMNDYMRENKIEAVPPPPPPPPSPPPADAEAAEAGHGDGKAAANKH